MIDPASGSATKKTDVFYTDADGLMKTPEKLPLGRYLIEELQGPEGYYNDPAYSVEFEIKSDRVWQVVGNATNDMDEYIITEKYCNHETLGQLMPLGMLVTLDAIYNRVIQNWKKGRRTWIFCDEFYILFRYEYSANFFYKLWKRIRKYNGLVTGLTQNVDELLRSDTARLMLANSEFLVMLNQSATDRAELAKLLNISDNQLGYVTNVPAGCGLIRCAGNIVPFTNSFPKNTKLYKLMSTNPSEKKE